METMKGVSEGLHCRTVRIAAGHAELIADISLPENAAGLVLFAHGAGSSRTSPANRHVAEILNRASTGSILLDLLTEREEQLQADAMRFDIDLLVERLTATIDWVESEDDLSGLGLGLFGAEIAAAAALGAAALRRAAVRAVVSHSGRPELAGGAIGRVAAPSLFIVGADDPFVLRLNREMIACLPRATKRRLEIVPAATHAFGEPAAPDRVAELAREWFQHHLAPPFGLDWHRLCAGADARS